MKPRWFAIGTVLAASAVALGAFGAHALESTLGANRMDTFETAVRYHMWHALGLMALAFSPRPVRIARISLLIGVVLFSGSLYALVFTNAPMWGAVAPVGGTALIAGWLLAGWAHLRD